MAVAACRAFLARGAPRVLRAKVVLPMAPRPFAAAVPRLQRYMMSTEAGGDDEFTELTRYFLDPEAFFQAVRNIGIDFYCGVPDSLLKDFCAYVTDKAPKGSHIITANEGAAVAMAAGHYFATRKPAMVYLQNSGIGNTVNPIMSLAHKKVYSVPMLIVIGWRGEPGKKDEPQHLIQGDITPSLLATMHIPFQILPDYIEGAEAVLETAKHYLDTNEGPYVLLVKRRTFDKYTVAKKKDAKPQPPLNREAALEVLLPAFDDNDVVVGTTGMLSRELYELRVKHSMSHERDFLTVGSMGFASSIASGIAHSKPNRRVICLDGDGAVLMHMGTLATNAANNSGNFKHVVFNNGAHDSVGGQPTVASGENFSLEQIALGSGYDKFWSASTPEEILAGFKALCQHNGPGMLEVNIRPGGARKDLGRPKSSPVQNKIDFMNFLDKA